MRDRSTVEVTLDRANWRAVETIVAQLSDAEVIGVYEAAEGAGPVADLAAEQMERRNLDY